MELRDYIDSGAKKAGSLTALSQVLGISQPRISKNRAYAEAMPMEICVKLADYINADKFCVIAAAKYAAEKSEEKKAFWRPFVEHAKAAGIVLTLSLVTNFVTPTPAQASNHANSEVTDLYYVKSSIQTSSRKWTVGTYLV